MRLITSVVVIMLFSFPAAAFAEGLKYILDVKIDVTQQKISGTAHLTGDTDIKINLSANNIHNIP